MNKKRYFTNTKGRTAIITGASSGIGEAFAGRLAHEGYDLMLIARRRDRLLALSKELEKKYNISAQIIPTDLASDMDVLSLTKKISEYDSIDMLVHCAGFGTRGFFVDVQQKKIENMINLHVMATMRLTRAVLPAMIARKRGYIINVSSISAFLTTSHYVMYSATKAFINMFTKGLKDELADTGVKIQALCPGLTKTEFMFTEEFKDFNYGDIPRFVWMDPEEAVEQSLKALMKDKIIFIPGRGNRIFVGMLTAPLLGTFLGWILSLAGRGKNAY